MSSSDDKTLPLDCQQLSHLSHNQLFDLIDTKIQSLVTTDPLLSHLPQDMTCDELEDLIGHQSGRSMALSVEREDNTSFEVIVDNHSNVKQLKKSIEKYYSFDCKRKLIKPKHRINWPFVWRSYCLVFDDHKLTDDLIQIKDLGISNKSHIRFIRKPKLLNKS